MNDSKDALLRIGAAWPSIVSECRLVLGSELHYQAMIYYALRTSGQVPVDQLAMNVKMWIANPTTELFRELDLRKHEDFRSGFEPIPDVCLFSSEISADWRRRNNTNTLNYLLAAIEVKASEREAGRLRVGEIVGDIRKLAAHKEEAQYRGCSFSPVMMVIDTAPGESEQMTSYSLSQSKSAAINYGVDFMYLSQTHASSTLGES